MINYKEITKHILEFLKSPERKDFAIKSAKEAHEASKKLVEEMRYKGGK